MKKVDLGHRALTALKWSYLGAVGRVVAQLIVQLLLARMIGPEAFGQATAAFFVLALGWLLSEGGFGSALVQRAEINDADISYALGWVLLISCSCGLLVLVGAQWIAQWLGGSVSPMLVAACGALIPVQAISNIPVSLLRRNLDMRRNQLIFLSGYLFAYGIVGLSLAWAGTGAWSMVVAFGVHSVVNFAASYWFVRHSLRPSLRGDSALRKFGLQVTGTNIANWAIENVDRLIVNRFWGTTALGEYTAAFTLSRAPANFLVSSVQSVTFASASRMQEDPLRLARAYVVVLNLVTLITCPAFVLLALHSDAVIGLLYGHRWVHAGPLFAAFCAGLPFFAVLAVSGPLLWAVDAVKQEFAVQVYGVVIVTIGFLLLRGLPLANAVWLIPFVYLFRAAMVYKALAARLHLNHIRSARAVSGGLLISGFAVVASFAAQQLPVAMILIAATAALVTVGVAFLVLRVQPMLLLTPEVVDQLKSRADSSALFRRICNYARLP